jgi:hypothetical protein
MNSMNLYCISAVFVQSYSTNYVLRDLGEMRVAQEADT